MDKVVHFEIPFDDAKRAKEFYSKVFGWKIEDVPQMNYHMVHTVEIDENRMPKQAGAINGGLYKRDDKSAKSPVIVIDVAKIDDYVKKIKKAGGKVVREKSTVGDMGFYAQVSDTEGNVIGIWETIQSKK